MDPEAAAQTYLADAKFHRSFKLPPSSINGLSKPIRITYSDVGNPRSTKTPVFYCPPAFGGRYISSSIDALARRKGVRVICYDRFGIGGTEMVPINMRLVVWLELVPQLLKHLGIAKVMLVGQSIGAVYLLNLILHHRHLLDNEKPLAVLLNPWMQATQSGSLMMAATSLIPNALVSNFHTILPSMISLSKTFDTALNFSTGLVTQTRTMTPNFEEWVEDLTMDYASIEDFTGASQEALFALQKAGSWGWDSYPDVIKSLATNEKMRTDEEVKLRVRCFWGEVDGMIPKKGQVWFDKQWAEQDKIQYDSQSIPTADHNNILNQNAVIEWILNQL